MRDKFKFLAAAVFSASVFTVSALTVEEAVGRERLEVLRRDGRIQDNKFKNARPELFLAPETELCRKFAGMFSSSAETPTLVGENLYLVPKGSATVGDASRILRSISRMEGMQYYSHGDKKWETLYNSAYCIKGPKDRTRVDDNTTGSADGQVQHCFLEDNSLGKTNYRVSYFQTAAEVAVDFENTTGIYVGPIKAVGEGRLHINLVVTDCGDEFLVYMIVRAKFPRIGVLENRMANSLSARLSAIYSWFAEELGLSAGS